MSFDAYMLITGGNKIEGEATADGLTPPTGWFEIFSFSWGASNPTTVGSGGTGLSAGKVSLSSFNVMKKSEKASPLIFMACCAGQHFPTAQVVLRKATGATGLQQIFLKYEFVDILIESVQWSGSSGGDDTPTESVSFAYAKVTMTSMVQDTEKGGLKTGNVATWDQTKVVNK